MSDNYDLQNLPEHPEPRVVANKLEPPISGNCDRRSSDFDAAQWTLLGPGMFTPSGRSFTALPPGYYAPAVVDGRLYADARPLVTDKLSVLPGSCNERVVTGIRRFWESRELYRQYGLNYKRGVLFYGPPGSGKTATVQLLCQELIQKYGGAVIVATSNTELLTMLLHKLRKIEPERSIIVVMEDIDEIIARDEHPVLALLDGEEQIDNVVYLASTNYPERLGARIVNRPSRFDERIFVDMPSDVTRRAYFELVTASFPLSHAELERWTRDTKGMSVAHLREIVVSVRCLGNDYADVIERLKTMATRPRAKEGLGSPMGLTA